MVITPFGNCAPNLKLKATSCYITKIGKTLIVIDAGIGINWSKIDYSQIENVIIIITHLHCDHVNGLLSFPVLKPTHVYIPFRGIKSKKLRKLLNKKIDFLDLEETLTFKIEEYNFSFCKTNHCIETYAVKIKKSSDIFVYTSDIKSVDEKLATFCRNAKTVFVDSGNPIKKLNLKYHGKTQDVVESLIGCNIEHIFLTHLKPQLINYYIAIATKKDCNVLVANIGIDVFNIKYVYNIKTYLGEKVAS